MSEEQSNVWAETVAWAEKKIGKTVATKKAEFESEGRDIPARIIGDAMIFAAVYFDMSMAGDIPAVKAAMQEKAMQYAAAKMREDSEGVAELLVGEVVRP